MSSFTKNSNLWESLLRDSSLKNNQVNNIVYFFGDSNIGKSKLLEKFCLGVELKEKQSWNLTEIISYDYFSPLGADDGPGGDLESNLVGVWSFNNQTALGGNFEASLSSGDQNKVKL